MKRLILISGLLALGMIMILNISIASASLSDGLVAYYPFNGNADDASGKGNDGTEYGDITYKSGIIGQSVSFDGVDDHINVKSHTSINPIDQITISFWVKVEGFTNVWSPIIHKGGPWLDDYSNREYAVFLANTTSFCLCSAGDDSSQHYCEAYGGELGGWTHYVGIIDRKNHLMKIYVDAILKAEEIDSYSTFNNNDNELIFGSSEEVDSAISPFKGRLDDLRIYNRPLSEDEIKSLYNEVSHAITVPVESTFDAGLEGWTTGYARELRWAAAGGNPNGYARWQDFGAGSTNLFAPASFLGDWSALDGVGFISFDLKIFSTGTYNSRGYIQVTIAGPDSVASWVGPRAPISCPGQPGCDWTKYVVPLIESKWRLSGSWNELLANVTSFQIQPEFYWNIWGPEITGLDNVRVINPNTIGETIKVSPNYEFSLEQYTQKTQSIQLINPGSDYRSCTLEVVNPHSGLTVSLTHQNPISIAPGEIKNLPIVLDAGLMPAGAYDGFLLKLTVDDGTTLYSNIKVYIMPPGTRELPDLVLGSQDIQLTDYNLGDSVTLTTAIHNRGLSLASNVQVKFYEFDNLLGETVIAEVPAEGIATTSITAPITTSGEHLIRVVADPSDTIQEFDETNNEASQIIQLCSQAPIPGNILVTGSLPSNVYTASLFTITGRAVYDLYVDGTRYTNYVVKGGAVQITIKGDGGDEWVYGNVHTDVNGRFSKHLQAPASPGSYHIIMTVTDKTFAGKRELQFSATDPPPSPSFTPPPMPPTSSGSGTWNYLDGTWNWTWTTPPKHEPSPESDLRVYSENIRFSDNNPAPDEEITVFAEILYWATSTALVAQNVPVNFYVTYPGSPKMKIGETLIESISVGAPDFGFRYVYATWKNRGQGIYIVEVEIDPSYSEQNHLNNAATRAIIVGQLQSYYGVISGQVMDPWGGVGDVTIKLFDPSVIPIAQTLTDHTGYYLFENVPVGENQVRIDKPAGYAVDAEAKTATVSDQSVSVVNFHLRKHNPPIADAGGPYEGCVGEPVTLDGSASSAQVGTIVAWDWDLDGDGEYDDAFGENVEWTWDTEGTFTIGLKVTSSDSLEELVDEDSAAVDIKVCEVPQPELCPNEYRWGDPAPGYSFANWPIFESWTEVCFVNNGPWDAFNVTATITCVPVNVTIVDGAVSLGDLPAGSGAWSTGDTFTLRVDMGNPQDPDKGICWRVEYDDVLGDHHVIENVAKYCGEECSDICP